jgi:hypothetical protein
VVASGVAGPHPAAVSSRAAPPSARPGYAHRLARFPSPGVVLGPRRLWRPMPGACLQPSLAFWSKGRRLDGPSGHVCRSFASSVRSGSVPGLASADPRPREDRAPLRRQVTDGRTAAIQSGGPTPVAARAPPDAGGASAFRSRSPLVRAGGRGGAAGSAVASASGSGRVAAALPGGLFQSAREREVDVRAVTYGTGDVAGAYTRGNGIKGTSKLVVDASGASSSERRSPAPTSRNSSTRQRSRSSPKHRSKCSGTRSRPSPPSARCGSDCSRRTASELQIEV